METICPNPWDWIAQKCRGENWRVSASMAAYLAGLEYDLWGDRNTVRWSDMFRFLQETLPVLSHKSSFLIAVSRYKDFKVGCVASGYLCEYCILAKKYGICYKKQSVPSVWATIVTLESGEARDEKDVEWLIERFERWYQE